MRLLLLLPILYASLVWITVARPLTYSTLHFQDPAAGLTPGENCEMCQIVLRTVFGHFSANVPSRKKLTNQLKHECKRHFHVGYFNVFFLEKLAEFRVKSSFQDFSSKNSNLPRNFPYLTPTLACFPKKFFEKWVSVAQPGSG